MKTKEISENAAPQERKKGILRMIELLDRDSGKFFKPEPFLWRRCSS